MNTVLVENNSHATGVAEKGEQYSLAKILGIRTLASLPGVHRTKRNRAA